MSRLSRLEDSLVPIFVKKYGSGSLRWDSDEVLKGEIQFASDILFVTAVFEHKSGVVTIPLVVKYEMSNDKIRKWLKLEEQFYNEVYAYENVLPFLNKNNIVDSLFPTFYFGYCSESCPDDDVIVLQDLRPDGFKLSKEIIFLDYEHCAVAMRQIGRYHALSYDAKQNKPKEFYDKIKYLKECRFREDMVEDNYYLFTIATRRATQPFLDRNEYIEIVNRLREKMEDANNFLLDLVKPEEPLAVICHGDYCRNNILFRYDSNNKPIDARLVDIATSRYASPAIDISFFLFLNTTHEMRKLYWDDFLRIYHEAVVETAPGVTVPSLEEIGQEVLKRAVYGYAMSSFFLPALLGEDPFNPAKMVELSPEERSVGIGFIGGQKATDVTSALFKELVERGCVK